MGQKSFTNFSLSFDTKDNGFCKLDISDGVIRKTGYTKLEDAIFWIKENLNETSFKLNDENYSENLVYSKKDDTSEKHIFRYNPSIRDIQVYQKGQYVRKQIYLPQLLSVVNIKRGSNRNGDAWGNNWNLVLYAFEGILDEKTTLYSLRLPHFFGDASICLGTLTQLKNIKSIKEAEDIINYIFSTKFSHEWNSTHNLFTKNFHYLTKLKNNKNYIKLLSLKELLIKHNIKGD